MERKFRLLEVGKVPPNVTYSLVFLLEAIQDVFSFEFDGTVLEMPAKAVRSDGTWDDTKIERQVVRFMADRGFGEHPIAITAAQLPDDTFSSSDEEVTLLSIHGWETFSRRSPVDGLAYLVAGALLDCYVRTKVHLKETRACPNDYCDTLSDVDKGMDNGLLCRECSVALQKGMKRGDVSLREVVAIKRILDHVAGRRLLFVLMPLSDKFDSVYRCIAAAAKKTGFECVRADEVREPSVIVDSISEMIGRAELVVADLTGSNPNVFYELGEAHATGKSTILIRHDDPKTSVVPFDLRHHRYVQYELNRGGLAALRQELVGYMAEAQPSADSLGPSRKR